MGGALPAILLDFSDPSRGRDGEIEKKEGDTERGRGRGKEREGRRGGERKRGGNVITNKLSEA